MTIRRPTHVYHVKVGSEDTATIIRAHNADLRQDQPASISVTNDTHKRIISDNPIWLTMRDVALYDDALTGERTIVATGYRADSAFFVRKDI